MSAYNSDFGEIKYMSFLTKDDELLEKYNEIWEKVSKRIQKKKKKKIDSELYIMKNTWKLKQNLMRKTSTQIFTIIKCQKKVLNAFAYQ